MIDWSKIKYFSPDYPSEAVFKEVEDLIEPGLMSALDEFRDLLGTPIDPSPLKSAWARFDAPTSQHYVEVAENGRPTRLSCAGDIFLSCDIRTAFRVAVGCGLFGGIGIYLDTKYNGNPRMMMHLDIRKVKVSLWWARINGVYVYAHKESEYNTFFKALAGII